MASGLALLLGKAKGEDDSEEESPSSSASPDTSPARAYAKEVWTAFKDDDEEGFIQALLSLTKSKSEPAEPDEDDEM